MTRAHDSRHRLALAVCLLAAVVAAPVGGQVPLEGSADSGGAALEDATAVSARTGVEHAVTGAPDGPDEGNATNWSVGIGGAGIALSEPTVGEAFASAVAAHDTELEGKVRRRTLEHRLTLVGNGTSRAQLLEETVQRVRLRLARLTARRQTLRASYRNGTISLGRYRVALARVTEEARTLQRVLRRSDRAAEQLPRQLRVEYGLRDRTFEVLRARADMIGSRETIALEGIVLEPSAIFYQGDRIPAFIDCEPTLNGTSGGYAPSGNESYGGDRETATTRQVGTDPIEPQRGLRGLMEDVLDFEGGRDGIASQRSTDQVSNLDPCTRTGHGFENGVFVERLNGTTLSGADFEPNSTFDGSDWFPELTDSGDELDSLDWYTPNGSDWEARRSDDTTTARTGERYADRRATLQELEGNVSELDRMHGYLADQSDGDREVEEALTCARNALDDASMAIEEARTALEEGNPARADDRIANARTALERARRCLEQAREALQDDGSGSESTPTDWTAET